MKLQYISDIHLERKPATDYHLRGFQPMANYLALCGDIGDPKKQNYANFMKYVSQNFDKVFLVNGNHDLDFDPKGEVAQEICRRYDIHFLEKDRHDLAGGYRVLGTILWSNKNTKRQEFKHCLRWLGYEKELAIRDRKKVIVLTHHLPSFDMIHEKYRAQRFHRVQHHFASNLDYMISPPFKYWLCGHSHCVYYKYINGVYCGINTYHNHLLEEYGNNVVVDLD